jgi:YfiH family protein
MHFELVPERVRIKIYNREFKKSTHYYLKRQADEKEVANNHNHVINDIGAESLCVLEQVHGTSVTDVSKPWGLGEEPNADGIFTNLNKVALGIQTADCVPVLISSSDGEYIAGLHCGWKSAVGGLIGELKNKLSLKTKQSLIAVICPSIQKYSYEVGEEFYQNFIDKSESYKIFFEKKSEEKFYFDIADFVKSSLIENSIEVVKHFNEDTFSNPQKYPSHRYSTVNNLGKYKGSILSVICKY